MKKILCLVVFLAVSFSLLTAQDLKEQIDYKALGAPLPEIRAVDGKLREYSNADFRAGNSLFVVMFNPTCGHCITMGQLIGMNHEAFKQDQVLFLAGAPMMPYLKSFLEATEVFKYPEIIVGIDSAQFVDKAFGYGALPQINVYDKERRLIKVFNGDTPFDSLKVYLSGR